MRRESDDGVDARESHLFLGLLIILMIPAIQGKSLTMLEMKDDNRISSLETREIILKNNYEHLLKTVTTFCYFIIEKINIKPT